MDGIIPFLLPFGTGLFSGFVVAMPIGPVNITVINEAANHGLVRALLVGAGAVLMDMIYCSIGLAGFSGLFTGRIIHATMQLVSFVLALYLGVKYFRAKSLPKASPTEGAIIKKLHPHTAFMIGFVQVLGNPTTLLFWIALSAVWVSHEWVSQTLGSKGACVLGVGIGTMGWFALIAWLVSRGHKKFSDSTLLRIARCSGLALIGVAVFVGGRLVISLARP